MPLYGCTFYNLLYEFKASSSIQVYKYTSIQYYDMHNSNTSILEVEERSISRKMQELAWAVCSDKLLYLITALMQC